MTQVNHAAKPVHGVERFDIWAPEAGAVTLLAGGERHAMSRRPGNAPADDGWWTAPDAPTGADVDCVNP